MTDKQLPITQVIPELKHALLSHSAAVLIAQPGAGKTTVTPLELLHEPWLAEQKIIMLEPRRLAARAAAAQMARALGESTGKTVGYRVRMDTKVGPSTRIEVVTEGVLTRMLQHDQALEGVGLIIFDEFHERSLHADLGLALALQSQALLRPDLKILIMSATLEAEPVCRLLGDAPLLECPGTVFPVETLHMSKPSSTSLESFTAETVEKALYAHEGDLLVFLPGAREIHRTERELMSRNLPASVKIIPLYGSMKLEQQDEALRPSAPDSRKVVLATSIAESSLTIAGITVVIDSGLSRESVFSARTGMSRLTTVKVSKASADQRRGRAGRLQPGVCYRLWSAQEHAALPDASRPEIAAADLASLALELATWGVREPAELAWLDAPPEAAYRQATGLLRQLGCLEAAADGTAGGITAHGREVSALGTHPRLGHMLLRAAALGLAPTASRLAALLQERDPFRAHRGTDLLPRLDALREAAHARSTHSLLGAADDTVIRRIVQESRQLLATLPDAAATQDEPDGSAACGLLLAFAYPDRIAQGRGDGRFLLSGGRGARLRQVEWMSRSPYLVAAEVDDEGADGAIQLAAPIELQELIQHCSDLLLEQANVYWDSSASAVRARKVIRLGSLILKETSYERPPAEEIAAALMQGVRERGLKLLTWSRPTLQLQARLIFMHFSAPEEWPDSSESALLDSLESWLLPFALGAKNLADLQRLDSSELLLGRLNWEQRQQLEQEAPTHIRVPSGSRIPVDYSQPEAPSLAVRLQELFGMKDTPRIGRGRVPIVLHLLSPAQRPVQVTSDLSSFWSETYFEVKKDLKGRYPKHYWPDDPLEAVATNRAKPKR
ncbi:ATP-dependent helicase HrpB [Paenibacillus sp. M-152]|uniref:ATP-dependent helicase HrpB n=1 Tax=Paenibacillus sp. M-152 TaxID=2487928 RepID=UPI000F6FE74A|nr:ATP-dependent helicase HrpB [Paenibacillus sp. M-152]AZH29202.1 ATP-dependent helicase HrpB [Paenibacillus sp. M-152]